ncbi:MAG: insulinase family protein [Elusimicrobia bacterium]|nr:insulinase family protein [Elusimicrobiota bacterium]
MGKLIFAVLLGAGSGLGAEENRASGLEYRPPLIQQSQLANGLKLALVESRRVALVQFHMLFPFAGAVSDPQGKESLASFAAAMLAEGSVERDGDELFRAAARLGTDILVKALVDAVEVKFLVAKERFDEAMALAAEIVQRPAFPGQSLERLKQSTFAAIKQSSSDPKALASQRLMERIYSSHPLSRRATEESVKAIETSDLRAFHAQRIFPRGAVIAVTGDIAMSELEAMAGKHWGGWAANSGPIASVASPPDPRSVAVQSGGLVIELIDVPAPPERPSDRLQAILRIGQLALPRNHPDWAPFLLMNEILGGGEEGRLEKNIRQANGWTYGAYSGVSASKTAGHIAVRTDVQADKAGSAVIEVLRELRRLREQPVTPQELDIAKRQLSVGFLMGQQKIQNINARLALMELYGLPSDDMSTYRDRIMAVTEADIQRVARFVLHPEAVRVVVAGDAFRRYKDAPSVLEQLQAIGPVRLLDAEGRERTPAEPAHFF